MTQAGEVEMDQKRAVRSGPRPLPLHLTTAMLTWLSSPNASKLWKNGLLPWNPTLRPRAEALANALTPDLTPDLAPDQAAKSQGNPNSPDVTEEIWAEFSQALEAEIGRRANDLLTGILAYRRHPYSRPDETHPAVWSEGTTHLLDYAPGARKATPVLVVPSLVNRHYVLDLVPGQGFLGFLVASGYRPMVVDWGAPGEIESNFTLTDYIAGRLERVLDTVLAETEQQPIVLGYCMGGLLALALAGRRAKDVAGLALLATPWDFAEDAPAIVAGLPALEPSLGATIDSVGILPTDLIQALFFGLDPMQVIRKFLRFAELDPDSAEAMEFVAVEDWLNDGVPLAGPVAREALFGWYGRNTPAGLAWRVAGDVVDPGDVTVPALAVIPSRDRIVPPGSARALARALPNCRELATPLGHIGMAVSRSARKRAWLGILQWMENI